MELKEREDRLFHALNMPFTNITIFPHTLKNLDTTEAIVFAIVYEKTSRDATYGVPDEEGYNFNKVSVYDWFEMTTDHIAERTFLDRSSIDRAMNKLRKKGIFYTKIINKKRHIKLNFKVMEDYISGVFDDGDES